MRPCLPKLGPLILLVSAVACSQSPITPTAKNIDQYIPDPHSVPFDIEPVNSTEGSLTWLGSYSSQGKAARFKLVFGTSKASEGKEPWGFDIKAGTGRFLAEPGSDASVLLSDLKKALEAEHVPARIHRVSNLPFTYVSFGERQSQAANGGFNASPPGNWTPIKIFIGEGENEGQVYVNINPAMKKGQFSMKDPDYGDIVLAQLATVL